MNSKLLLNELSLTRLYDAPVKSVWEAWTDTEQAVQWWGPRGFTITTHSKDFKVGGHWHYTMHGPDGVDYPNKTKYFEVNEYSKMVYDHGGNDEQAPLFRATVTFEEINQQTKMHMIMAFASEEIAIKMGKFIKSANGDSTWDRLAEFLARKYSRKEQFVINRSFDTSIEKMFEVWTNPKHFSQWLAPTGFSMNFIRADIKAGGNTFYYMSAANGAKMYGKANYLEVKKPHHLLYTQQFCDDKENITRHPMAPTWPATMITKVTFAEEESGKTRVTIVWETYGKTSPEELKTFIQGRAGMTQGWTGSFDKLEEYLAQK